MAFPFSAKLVVFVHFGFVAFLFFGAHLFPTRRWLVWVHGPCLLYAILITVVDWPCPLTDLEKWLLARGGGSIYSGEFLPHYVWSRVGLTGRELPVALGMIVALLGANVAQYRALFRTDSTNRSAA